MDGHRRSYADGGVVRGEFARSVTLLARDGTYGNTYDDAARHSVANGPYFIS